MGDEVETVSRQVYGPEGGLIGTCGIRQHLKHLITLEVQAYGLGENLGDLNEQV
jgi:hypothetical protein